MARFKSTIMCHVALCGLSVPALAQDALPAKPNVAMPAGRIEELVVTAQKRSERVNSVPLSITAFSGRQLVANGITEPAQLEKAVPGFTVEKSFLGQPVFFVRGIGYADTAISANPAVSVYNDEMPLFFSAMSRGALLDLQRVEVLKGPQGTLFGQNSTGGAINFIAAKPTDQLQAGVDLEAGRFNEVSVSGFVSGRVTDKLTVRLALENDYQGDWQQSITRPNDTRGQRKFANGRIIADYTPTDWAKFEFTGQVWHDGSDIQGQQFVIAAPTIPVSPPGDPGPLAALRSQVPAPNNNRVADWDAGSPKARDDTFYQVGLRSDIDLSDSVRLTSLTDGSGLRSFTPIDADGTAYDNAFFRIHALLETFSQEIRLAGSIGPRLNWLVGFNYAHQDTNETSSQEFNSTNDATTPFPFHSFDIYDNQHVNGYGGFGSLDYKLTETLTARASARYTQEDRSFDGCLADSGNGQSAKAFGFLSTVLSGVPAVIPPGACITLNDVTFRPVPLVADSLNQNNVSWRAGLDWKAMPGTLLYVTVAKGYKSGAFSTIPGEFESQFTPATQESVLAYEGGAKLSLLDQRLQLNGAGFYYDYNDKQVGGYAYNPLFGNLPELVNIPTSSLAGGELEAVGQITPHLRARVAGTYLDSKIASNPVNPVCPITAPGLPCSFIGEAFPNTPKYQLTADLEQQFPIGDGKQAYIGGNLIYHSTTEGTLGSDQSTIAEAAFRIPAYTVVDLRAGLNFGGGKWTVEAWGRNVTNAFYITGVSRSFEEVTRYVGMPVTYGVRLRWRF